MDQEQLAALHTDAIRRHWRALADSGGHAPPGLLGELAAIAEHHADARTQEALKILREQPPSQPAASEPAAAADAGPAPRRARRNEPGSTSRTRHTTGR